MSRSCWPCIRSMAPQFNRRHRLLFSSNTLIHFISCRFLRGFAFLRMPGSNCLLSLFEQVAPQDKRVSIKELLCPTNEDYCTETVTDENLVQEICFHVNNGEGEYASEIETVIQIPPLEKQIEAIALIKLAAEQRMFQEPEGFIFLSRFQRQLKSEVVIRRKQTRIKSFFNEQ